MKLVIAKGEFKGKVFELEEGTNLIGRWDPDAGAFPEIDLEREDVDAKISRKHAVLERTGDMVVIEDVGSMNGTFINRRTKLEAGQKYTLADGDEVVVGKIFLKFHAK